MYRCNNKKTVHSLGWISLFIILSLTSCVTNNELTYTREQVSALNRSISGLKESIDPKIDAKLDPINSNLAGMTVEFDRLKNNNNK